MKKNNLLFYIIIFIISLLIVLTNAYLGRYNIILGDDFCGVYTKNSRLIDCLSFGFQTHGGGYLCTFLNQLLTFRLPIFLGIHPSDFIGIPSCTIKGIFTVILLFPDFLFFIINQKFYFHYFIMYPSCIFIFIVLNSILK